MDADFILCPFVFHTFIVEIALLYYPIIVEIYTFPASHSSWYHLTGEVIQLVNPSSKYFARFSCFCIGVGNSVSIPTYGSFIIQLPGPLIQDRTDIDITRGQASAPARNLTTFNASAACIG